MSLAGRFREWRIDRMTDRVARRPHGGHFYTDEELERLARKAGLTHVAVTRPDELGWAQLVAAQP